MLLAIDCGNTNTLFALHDGKRWRGQWRFSTETGRTADEYAAWLFQLLSMKGLKIQHIRRCIASTVVPQSLFHLRNLARRYFDCDLLVVGDGGFDAGIELRIDNPSEVGADRLVNTAGALEKYKPPLIIVDSGTATTFDVIGSDGAFEGGIITPGINLSLVALNNAAAKLPRIEIRKPDKIVGSNTVTAMQSGIFWGYVALIDGLVAQIKAEREEEMTVIGTGGVVSLFEGSTKMIDYFDAELTLDGLVRIAKNAGGKLW